MAPKYARPAAPVPAEWPTGAAYTETRGGDQCPGSPGLEVAGILHRREASASHRDGLDEQPRSADCRLECGTGPGACTAFNAPSCCRRSMPPAAGAKQRCPPIFRATANAQTVERYDANLGVASWEIDFFGRIRSLKDRALEEYLATEQARRSAQILLVSSVANAYLALAADRENLRLVGDHPRGPAGCLRSDQTPL